MQSILYYQVCLISRPRLYAVCFYLAKYAHTTTIGWYSMKSAGCWGILIPRILDMSLCAPVKVKHKSLSDLVNDESLLFLGNSLIYGEKAGI